MNASIIDYCVIVKNDAQKGMLRDSVEGEVKKLMKEGWEPLGGLAVHDNKFYQVDKRKPITDKKG